MSTPKRHTLRLNGRDVLPENYHRLSRLYAVAFGLTEINVPKRVAKHAAMEAAITALGVIMRELEFYKARSAR